MNIFYYLPSFEKPSWGAGMILYHVKFLVDAGFNACILTDGGIKSNKSWINITVPIKILEAGKKDIKQNDYLIVPEFYADSKLIKEISCKKIVFIQNAFYILDGLSSGKTYEELGFTCVFYYMKHLKSVLENITRLPLVEIPPFIAPYFFQAEKTNRNRNILVYPKFESRDYNILLYILRQRLKDELTTFRFPIKDKNKWKIVELKNLTHSQVAEKMKTSEIFICLNTTEAFNSAIPEAMAAGCLNLCYDGFGSLDFLENGINAYVFPNNHTFSLVEKIISIVNNFQHYQEEIESIKSNAFNTAERYKMEFSRDILVHFFTQNL